jgi:quinol-cytochrome oxidoreductase complex cytochrome b subunit
MILIFGILMTFFSAVAFVIEVRSKPRKIYKIVLCLLLFLGSVAVAFFGYSLFILASAP